MTLGVQSRLGLSVCPGELSALAGLFLAGFLAFGVGVYAFTQFLNPVQTEFGWNRAMVGGLMSAFWIAAPFVLLSAYLLDFLGIRTIVAAGAAIEAIATALLWITTTRRARSSPAPAGASLRAPNVELRRSYGRI